MTAERAHRLLLDSFPALKLSFLRGTPLQVLAGVQRGDDCGARGPPCTPNRKTEVNWTLEKLASGSPQPSALPPRSPAALQGAVLGEGTAGPRSLPRGVPHPLPGPCEAFTRRYCAGAAELDKWHLFKNFASLRTYKMKTTESTIGIFFKEKQEVVGWKGLYKRNS